MNQNQTTKGETTMTTTKNQLRAVRYTQRVAIANYCGLSADKLAHSLDFVNRNTVRHGNRLYVFNSGDSIVAVAHANVEAR